MGKGGYSHTVVLATTNLGGTPILDEGVREGLAIEVDTSLPAERVVRVLEQVVAWRGQPQAIRLDNVLHQDVKTAELAHLSCAALGAAT